MKSVQISPWAFFANVRRVDVGKLGVEKGHFETQLIHSLFSKLKGYCEKNLHEINHLPKTAIYEKKNERNRIFNFCNSMLYFLRA